MQKLSIVILLGLVFSLPLCGQNADLLLREGKTFLEQGRLDSAEQRLIAAVEANPTVAEPYYLLSQIYLKHYDLDKTREYIRTAIDIDQQNMEYREHFERANQIASSMAIARRSLEGGDSFDAIVKLEGVSSEFPEVSAMALYYMGLASTREDEISEGAKYFREAITEDPNYDKPRKALKGLTDKIYNEANQLFGRGDYERSAEKYRTVLEMEPSYFRAHFQLGVVRTRLGEYDQAIEHYQKAVDISPTYAKGWFALGLTYQRNGNYAEALRSLDKATTADPAHAKAFAQKGTIHLKQGDNKSAESEYKFAIQADPTYSKPYEDLGRIYIARENYKEAVNTLRTATSLNAKSQTAWYMLAQAYNALQECDEAKEAALSALDVKADYSPASFELGLAEACLGNKTAALSAFEKVRKDRSWRKSAEYEIDKIEHPERYQNR